MRLVAEYYDAMCNAIHTRFFAEMTWSAVGVPHHNYLADLKMLKAESKRDISVLQSRTQTAGLEQLGMVDSLGFRQEGKNANLGNQCMASLHKTLPAIDPLLEKYIATFHAPNVALFLRMIRCSNLMAFEHLIKTHSTPALKDEFQRRLRHFPLGTAADLDYIMQYTASNAKNVHSIYLQPVARKTAQSANIAHSTEYTFVRDLLESISNDPTSGLDRMLRNSALSRKLLLCHGKVYELLNSIELAAPDQDDAILEITLSDKNNMHKRIVRGLMQDTTLYYVFVVDRHIEISFSARKEEKRADSENRIATTKLRAMLEEEEECDEDHERRMEHLQMQYTRLTWPLRDLNVFTRISLPRLDKAPGGESISFPGNLSFATGEMHADEKQMYDWLEAVQTRNVQRSQQLAASIDSNTHPRLLPLPVLPSEMQQQYLRLETHQHAVDPTLVHEAASSERQIQQAWRWKSLLIQTTLLSALNGICHELCNRGRVPHRIATFRKVGMEDVRDTLTLQHFDLGPPKPGSSTPTYRVRNRSFFEETPTLFPPTGEGPLLICCNVNSAPNFVVAINFRKKCGETPLSIPTHSIWSKAEILSYTPCHSNHDR